MRAVDVMATWAEVNDYLVGRQDVIDGEAGPVPNDEMTLLRDVSVAFDVTEAMVKLVRELAGLREGLDNGNSSAEYRAARLAAQAEAIIGRVGGAA